MPKALKTPQNLVIWLVAGTQHLYGQETLRQVEANARLVVQGLNENKKFPFVIEYKAMVSRSEEASAFCRAANHDENCVGIITWLHTFSPAKMWIAGLKMLNKPMLQLHTQLNAEIPWENIDMDFMNLHQTAHGGREFGSVSARLRKPFSTAIGHWKEARVTQKIALWMQVCAGLHECRHLKVARIGDNMRDVAVTEGDKVEAQIRLGFETDAFAVGDLVRVVDAVSDADVAVLMDEYQTLYTFAEQLKKGSASYQNVADAARIELGLRRFLDAKGYKAFTTNFETLLGLKQLPGLAAQRLMADGYGFGAEGDWKTSALVRIMKVMGQGLAQGTSFMEDYTYHFSPSGDLALGAHMLEVCPSIAKNSAKDKPRMDVLPLGIGGKDDPARLIFSCGAGPAINAGILDMGNRFRLLINEIDVIEQPHPLPKLPVACAVWKYRPDFATGVEAWIVGGGGHHTAFSQAISAEHLSLFAEELGIECVVIGKETRMNDFKNELRWNELAFR